MSYTAQQIMITNEELLSQYSQRLQHLLDGFTDEVVIYTGPATGLSHYHYRSVESQLKTNDYLTVVPDPTNKYDINATGLLYNGYRIGWVPKAMNRVCAEAVRQGCALTARIIRHKEFNGDFMNILFVEVIATLTKSDEVPEQYKVRYAQPPPWKKQPSFSDSLPTSAELRVQHDQWAKETRTKYAEQISNQMEQQIMAKATVNSVIEKNLTLGTTAAFLEAGRIANNQLSSIASKKLPIMVRGYAETAMGRLLLANIAMMASEHFRPEDNRLRKLTEAMAVSSYQEVLQQFDIEQMIEDLVNNKTIAKALKAVDVDVEPA